MFRRVDLPNTQLIFLVYLAVAAVTILVLHSINSHTTRGPEEKPPRWQTFLPVATQFALGGLWSGFLFFYTRSAVLLASWPFLLVLVSIFIGNEVFKHYYERLAFTAVLLFFGLFSYAIVTVPIYLHQIGVFAFLLSGLAAIAAFTIFLWVLFLFGRKAFVEAKWPGSSAARRWSMPWINLFWFTNVLPPLPVALAKSGIYTDVKHVGDNYIGTGEQQPWYRALYATPVVHVAAGRAALRLHGGVRAGEVSPPASPIAGSIITASANAGCRCPSCPIRSTADATAAIAAIRSRAIPIPASGVSISPPPTDTFWAASASASYRRRRPMR